MDDSNDRDVLDSRILDREASAGRDRRTLAEFLAAHGVTVGDRARRVLGDMAHAATAVQLVQAVLWVAAHVHHVRWVA